MCGHLRLFLSGSGAASERRWIWKQMRKGSWNGDILQFLNGEAVGGVLDWAGGWDGCSDNFPEVGKTHGKVAQNGWVLPVEGGCGGKTTGRLLIEVAELAQAVAGKYLMEDGACVAAQSREGGRRA